MQDQMGKITEFIYMMESTMHMPSMRIANTKWNLFIFDLIWFNNEIISMTNQW